ncbi:MAG: polysaccharide deacetylase family protein [Egibacteraceae bacterium]
MTRFFFYGMLRDSLSPSAKLGLRRVADWLLTPVGSIGGVRTLDRTVALTFDDGPHPEMTARVLDVLARQHVLATFFLLVESAEAHPEIVRRMVTEGHEVGLHGIDHTALTTLPMGEVRRRLRQGRRRLEAVTGTTVRWFRPAYGAQSLRIYLEVRRAGMDVVVWSANPKDYAYSDAAEVAARTTRLVRPGGIILLHDANGEAAGNGFSPPRIDCAATVNALLEGLESQAYDVTTVSKLLEVASARRLAWFRPDKSPVPLGERADDCPARSTMRPWASSDRL